MTPLIHLSAARPVRPRHPLDRGTLGPVWLAEALARAEGRAATSAEIEELRRALDACPPGECWGPWGMEAEHG